MIYPKQSHWERLKTCNMYNKNIYTNRIIPKQIDKPYVYGTNVLHIFYLQYNVCFCIAV